MSVKAIALVAALLVTGGAVVLLASRDGGDSLEDSVELDDEPRGRRGKAPRSGNGSRSFDDDDPAPRFEPGEGSLEDRVAALEREVVMLRRQLAVRGKVAMAGSRSDLDSLADDPVLQEEVRGIVEEERERERDRQMELRRERFEELRIATLDELSQVASLTEEQRSTIDDLWTTEADKLLPLMSAVRAGEKGFMEVRDEARTIRQASDEAARAMLTDEQYQAYEELRPRGPGRGGPGRGGGRGPDRGPGGPPR